MTVTYSPGSSDEFPYYTTSSPDAADFSTLIEAISKRDFYNFVVSGKPKKISPEWLARHPGYVEDEYEYAVSYSIVSEDVDDILSAMEDEDMTIEEAFNEWLEGTGKEWIDITELKLVDRIDPWENA